MREKECWHFSVPITVHVEAEGADRLCLVIEGEAMQVRVPLEMDQANQLREQIWDIQARLKKDKLHKKGDDAHG